MNFKNFKLKEHSTTIARRIVQISFFIIINYVAIEFIFKINLKSFESLVKILPILSSPKNPLSRGAGMMEYIFFSMAEGTFPLFLIALFILIILFSNRFCCGWICPIGTIQDGLSAIPTKNKNKINAHTHENLLKLKTFILILIIIILVPLMLTKLTNYEFYTEYKKNLGLFGQETVGYFSLSEYIFVFLPNMIKKIVEKAGLDPLFSDFWTFFIFVFYLAVIIISVWYPRAYCKYFCPFGAAASYIADYSFLKMTRSPVRCVGRADCGKCEQICPKKIRILDEPFEFFTGKGECDLCLKCKEVCPYDAIDINFV